MSKIRISAVVPVYNREKTIKRCLDSIISQTVGVYEIILVDDGSTDSSLDIVKSYNCDLLRIIKNQHGGAQVARNTGIVNANGDYIAFLDSDDEWLPNYIQEVTNYIRSHQGKLGAVYSDCIIDKGKECKRVVWELPEVSESAYRFLLKQPGPTFNSVFKRDALLRIGLLDVDVPSFQEWDTFIRVARYYRICHLKNSLFVYYRNNADSISADSVRTYDGMHYIVEKHKKSIKKNCGGGVLLRKLGHLAKWNLAHKRVKCGILCGLEILQIPFI